MEPSVLTFSLPFEALGLDPLGGALLSVAMLIGLVTLVYVLRSPGLGHFFALVLFFLFLATLMFVTDHILVFYLLWEVLVLFAWALGQLATSGTASAGAGLPVQLAGVFSSLAMLTSLFVLVTRNNTYMMAGLRGDGIEWVSLVLLVAILLKTFVLVGYAWRDGRQPVAAAAGAFLVTAGVFAVGIYPFSRLLLGIFNDFLYWREVALWTGLAGGIVFGLAALGESDTRRALSFGALAQVLILFGVMAVPSGRGLAGLLLVLPVYAFSMSALFLALGLAEARTGQSRLSALGGLAAVMPTTALVFLLAALSLASIPPLGAFVGQVMVVSTLLRLTSIWPAVLYGAFSLVTVLYLLRLFRGIFLGNLPGSLVDWRSRSGMVALAALAILLVAGGLMPFWATGAVEPVVAYLMR